MSLSRTALLIVTIASFAFAFQTGPILVGTSSDLLGWDFRLKHSFGIRPFVSFQFGEGSANNFGSIQIATNFYLPDISKDMDHYFGIAPRVFTDNGHRGWNKVDVRNYYGAQYNFGYVTVFVELGYIAEFNPFKLTSSDYGLGFIFYVHHPEWK